MIFAPTLGIRDDGMGKEGMRASKRLKPHYGSINETEENIWQPTSSDPKLWTQLEEDSFRIEHVLYKIISEQFPFEECDNKKTDDVVEVIKIIEHSFSRLYYKISTPDAVVIPDKKAQTGLHVSSPDILDSESIYWLSNNADLLFNIGEDDSSAYVTLEKRI